MSKGYSRRRNKQMASTSQSQIAKKNGAKMTIHAEHRSTFIGPLPPPGDLELYGNIIPDGANRIMKMAENQSSHRMELEKMAMLSNVKRSITGLWLGFFIVLSIVAGSFYIAANRSVTEGIIGAVSTMLLGIVYYIIVYKTRKLELSKHAENNLAGREEK